MKTPILDRLKQATRERHEVLEGKLPLLDPHLSLDNYRHLVSKFYGYYAPMELMLLALPWWDEVGLNVNERQKAPGLEQDLLVLGYKPETLAQIPRCQHLPEVKSISQFLGCLYVMEGATHGGQTSQNIYRLIFLLHRKRVPLSSTAIAYKQLNTGKHFVHY